MKKILIAVLVVLAVLVGGGLALPSLVDWNTYKVQIAERVSAATGRAVELRGDLSLSLLPSPALTVRDARLANAPGAAEPDMARLKKLDVRVALGPLLGGRIQVESITMVEPTFVVEVLPDGRVNWDFPAGTGAAGKQPGTGDGLASAVSFDQVTLQNGTVLYRDARSGRSERLEALDARVVAGSLAGPFQLQGNFRFHGTPLRGEVTTGRFTEGAAVPIRASLGLTDSDATLRFAGIVSAGSGGGLKAQGDLRAEGGDLSRVVEPGSGMALPALAQPFNLRTTLEAGRAGASFANLEFQLGDTRATGSAVMRTGTPTQAEVTLALNRLDLDSWLSRSTTVTQKPAASGTPVVPAALQLPDGIELRLDLAADALTYNGAVVRQGRLESSLTGGRLSIDRLSALLPGGSDFVAAGEVTTPGGVPTLDVRMEANADNLRALLDWMKLDTRAFPPDRLRRASLSGRFQGTPSRFELGGIDLRVDTSRLTGAVAYVDRGRPAFGARLDLDRLNLDAYLPVAAAPAVAVTAGRTGGGQPAAVRQGTGAGAATGTELPLRLLRDVDANLNLTVGSLTARGLPVQGLHVDATAAAGTLTVREARVDDFLGLKGRLDGQVAGLSPLRGVNLAVSGEAASLGGLPRAVHWPAAIPAPERLGAVRFQGRVAGDAAKLALELTAGAAGATLEAGGSLAALDGDPVADLKLRVGHPELGHLAALFGDARQARAYGPLDLYGELSGTRKAPVLNNLQGIIAGVPMRGRVSAALDGTRPKLTAEVQTGDLDFTRLAAAPLLAAKGASPQPEPAADGTEQAFDLGWLGSFDGKLGLTSSALLVGERRIERPALRAVLDRGVLTLEQLDGEFAGGQIGVTGQMKTASAGLPAVEADVILVRTKLDQLIGSGTGVGGNFGLSGGTLDLDATLATAGNSRAALLRGLSGNGRFSAQDGILHGLDIGILRDRLTRLDRPQELLGAVASGLNGGKSGFARMTGSFAIKDGVVRTEDTSVQSDLGEATATGQVSLPDQTVDLRLRVAVKSDQPLPPLSGRVSGPLAAPTRSFDMREVQDYFARRAAETVLQQAVPQVLPQTGVPGLPAEPEKLLKGLIDGLTR